VAAEAGTGERYATQVGRLWSGLTGTLARLEAIAAEPARLEEDEVVGTLRGLQYRLHLAVERAHGLAPPSGTEAIHAELAAALEGARDATGEVAEAVEVEGPEAAELLAYEWRGALFRVRLARLRLAGPRRRPVESRRHPDASPRPAAIVALLLAVAGTVAFTLGAGSGQWPVWAGGLVVLGVSFVIYKP
jgi:hypothetical protein